MLLLHLGRHLITKLDIVSMQRVSHTSIRHELSARGLETVFGANIIKSISNTHAVATRTSLRSVKAILFYIV